MRRKYGLALGIVIALLFGALALFFGLRSSVNRRAVPTTYSVSPQGCKALFLVMEKLKLPVGRLRKPFTRLSDAGTVLIVIDPRSKGPGKREVKKLDAWIRKGNALLLFEAFRNWDFRRDTRSVKKRRKKRPRVRISNRIGRSLGLNLEKIPHALKQKVPIAFPGVEEIRSLEVTGRARWTKLSKEWDVLAKDESGPVVVTRKFGAGRVVAVSDPRLPSNKNLGREDNLRFMLAAALDGRRPKKILFDEYHHGYVFAESLSGYLGASVFLWIFIQALLGALLFFYSQRARLSGRFRSLAGAKGRSSLEYVASMANIFESCGASSAALEAILKRFLGRLSRRIGISPRSLESNSAGKIRWDHRGAPEDAARLIADCRRAIRADEPPDRALVLARRLGAAGARMDRGRPMPLQKVR